MAVIFCMSCASPVIDVSMWHDNRTPGLKCSSCGHEGTLSGFTLGRPLAADLGAILETEDAAASDAAQSLLHSDGAPERFMTNYELNKRPGPRAPK
jgi:hypothetical protein